MVRPTSDTLRSLVCAFIALLANAMPADAANVAPEVLQTGLTRSARIGGSAQQIDLQTVFRDPDSPAGRVAVRVNFRIGAAVKPVDIVLFDQAAPNTTANFLAYMNSDRQKANFIHRSVPGFVIQGGGFAWNDQGQVYEVPTFSPVVNEPGISNTRGTVAMAKLGGDPNSATSQWFINLADNSANLDAQNGGFTVFGKVVRNGMAVADEVAALPRYNAGGAPFDTLPLKDYVSGAITRTHTIETNSEVAPLLSFSASSSNSAVAAASLNGSTLTISPGNTAGTATITVTATDLDDASTQTTIAVTTLAKSQGWHVETSGNQVPTIVLNPADSTPLAADPIPIDFGQLAFGSTTTRTITVRNDGPDALTDFGVIKSGPNAAEYSVTSGAGPATLNAGASATIEVALNPVGGGERKATLFLASSNPDQASVALSLTMHGIDGDAPVVSQPSPQTLTATVHRTAVVPDYRNTLVTAIDNAGVASFTQTPAPGSILPIGQYVAVFTAADAAGNSTTVQTTLTVQYSHQTLPALVVGKAHGGAPVPSNASSAFSEGSVMSAFGTPAISDDRSLTSRITVTSGRAKLSAIYFEEESGANRIVAHQGQDTGITGAKFKSFRDPLISHDGAVAFAATVAGVPATENEGVWTDRFGDLQLVLRKGSDIPGLAAGLKLKSVTSLSFDDNALLALVKIQPARGGVTAADDTALVRITGPSSGTQLARTGELFDQVKIKQISVLQPAARSVGQGRWTNGASTVVKLTLLSKATVIARITPDGTTTTLLRTGAADENLGYAFASLGLPAIGGQGITLVAARVAERGIVTAANDGMILHAADGTSFSPIASEEVGLGKFVSFSDPVTNNQGEILSYGTRRAAEAKKPNINALWSWTGAGSPSVVAQIGQTATDAEGKPLEDATWSAFPSFALPNGTGAGPIFVGQLAGKGVNGSSKLGLWAVDSGGTVRMILRAGQDIQTPTGTKQVASFTVLNSLPGSFGAQRSYNSTGAVAVQATFTDRSQAILRLDVP